MDLEQNRSDVLEEHSDSVTEHSFRSASSHQLVTGVPYIHPNVEFVEFDRHERLAGWDRAVVLAGGCIFGFALGASSSLFMFAMISESLSRGLLLTSGICFVSMVISGGIYWQTQRLLSKLDDALQNAEAD